LGNYRYVLFENQVIVHALRNSLSLGIGVALLAMVLASLLSYYTSRATGPLGRALDTVAMLPATVPHIVMGVAFLVAFSQPPLQLYGTTALLFLAYLAIFMPQAMQSARFAFGQVAPELMEASMVFGASEARSFIRILVPLILPSTFAGLLIVTVLSVSETNASVILSNVNNAVIGPTLYNLWSDSSFPPVAAVAILICALNAAVSAASLYLGRAVVTARVA
jgi:iron(III) transport system permease protein